MFETSDTLFARSQKKNSLLVFRSSFLLTGSLRLRHTTFGTAGTPPQVSEARSSVTIIFAVAFARQRMGTPATTERARKNPSGLAMS